MMIQAQEASKARSSGLETFLRLIDTVNHKVGTVVGYILLPLAIVTLFEVIARYVFDAPTIWAWDTNVQIFGVVILLGVGYTLLNGRHVSIEAVTERLPPRTKLTFELVAMLLIMFIAVIFVWQGGMEGWQSFVSREKMSTLWAPPIFHIKMLYPIAGILLFIQALAKFIRDLSKLVRLEA